MISSANAYEIEQFNLIQKYNAQEPSVIQKGVSTLLKPVTWVVQKVVPNKVIEGVIIACNSLGDSLADADDIKRDGGVDAIVDLKTKSLELSDKLADSVHNWALGLATAEGGATGTFGLLGMAADIPALITLAYRTIYKIALCYGYENHNRSEEQFANTIMAMASASTISEKVSAQITLKELNTIIAKQTWKKMAENAANNQFSKESVVLTIKALAKQINVNITKRTAMKAIPIVGGGIGAAMNAAYIQDIAWAARRAYQQRWLSENGKIVEN